MLVANAIGLIKEDRDSPSINVDGYWTRKTIWAGLACTTKVILFVIVVVIVRDLASVKDVAVVVTVGLVVRTTRASGHSTRKKKSCFKAVGQGP